jgi:TolB-like protein/uncharacterized membrane protein YhdT
MNSFFKELRRRNIFRVAGVYAVVGWLLAQVAATLEGAVGLPGWFDGMVVSLLLIGFPIALILAWAFEMTPDGVRLTAAVPEAESISQKTGRKLDYAILAGLALVAVLVVGDRVMRGAAQTEVAGAEAPAAETAQAEPAPINADADPATAAANAIDRSKSIAVLPFADFSAGGDHEWFSDGLTEEILNALARTPDLLVASRTSSFKYKGADEEIPIIAKALGVEHVLEGSVRRAGERLRITAQLIRAGDGFHLWSENYDRSIDDVIAIQEDIAVEIATALETAMDPEALAEMVSAGTRSVEAYQAYLEGLAHFNTLSARGDYGLSDAYEAYERARKTDANFAAAHYNAAQYWVQSLTPTVMGTRDPEQGDRNYREFRARIDAAIDAAQGTPEHLRYTAQRAIIDYRLREAEDALEKFLGAKPLSYDAWFELSDLRVRQGDFAGAATANAEGEKLVGDNVDEFSNVIINYVWSKDYENAARTARHAIALDPDHWSNMYQAHRALLWAGAVEEAAPLVPHLVRNAASESSGLLVQVRQACAEGDHATAEQLTAQITAFDASEALNERWIAFHLLGRKEEAAQLITAYDRSTPPILMQSWLYYPYFDHTRHPHFIEQMKREGVTRPPAIEIPFACPQAENNE